MRQININDPILRISDEELFCYIKCPNLFYLKYLSRIPIPPQPTFGELVRSVIDGYFAKLLEQKLPTIDKAKKDWDKICEDYPKTISDKKVLEGFGLINLFDKYCFDNKLIVADFNTPYEIPVGGNVIITGNIGAIRIVGSKLELFSVETSQAVPNQNLLNMSLKHTLQCYAANKLYPKYDLNSVRILHLKSGQEFTTYRSKIQYDRLEKTIQNVSRAIREEIFFPREDFTCAQCRVKNYCGYY